MPTKRKPRDYHRNVFLGHWAEPEVAQRLRRHARKRKLPLAILLRQGDVDLLARLDRESIPTPEAR